MYKRKNLGIKSQEHSNLKFSGRLFVSESMSHENQQLTYKCRQLKNVRKICSTFSFKLTDQERIHKIFHLTDIEQLLETENLEEYINKAHFLFN